MINGRKPRPMLLGDRVHLLGEADGAFKDYAVVGTVTSRGLAVVLLAEYDKELAPMFVYPATHLTWNAEGGCWTGPLPSQDRSSLILPGGA